jgi:dienelactone hydrolase
MSSLKAMPPLQPLLSSRQRPVQQPLRKAFAAHLGPCLSACLLVCMATTHLTLHASTPEPVATIVQINGMHTQVYKPPGTGPFKVLLYAHSRPAYARERARLLRPIHARHVQYWLRKGYAVVAPLRPGYGATGGPDRESSGAGYSASGQCIRQPSPGVPASQAAAAMRQALDWVRQQPWARASHIVLEGQSTGGLATVALCAAQPPGVVGCINFSGGAGGDPQHAPQRMCAPEKTTALMRTYGQTTKPPSIWFYAPNDLYWGAAPPKQWHAAFNQAAQTAGPSAATPSQLVTTVPIGSNGHSLQRAGSQHWEPPLEAWLQQNGL